MNLTTLLLIQQYLNLRNQKNFNQKIIFKKIVVVLKIFYNFVPIKKQIKMKGRKLKCYEYFISKLSLYEITEEELIEFIETSSEVDPSGNNKYLNWLVRERLKSIVSLPIVIEDLTYFHNNVSKFDSKDIECYDHNQLHDVCLTIKNTKSKSEIKKIINETSEIILDNSEYLVVVPHSWESSKYWGVNTKWCTTTKTGPEHYFRYTENGYLYYVIDKLRDYKEHPMSKIAINITDNFSISIYNTPDCNLGNRIGSFLPENVVKIIREHYQLNSYNTPEIFKIVKDIIYQSKTITKIKISENEIISGFLPHKTALNYEIKLTIDFTYIDKLRLEFELIRNKCKVVRVDTFLSDSNLIITTSKKLKLGEREEVFNYLSDFIRDSLVKFNKIISPIVLYPEIKSEVSKINNLNKKGWMLKLETDFKIHFKELNGTNFNDDKFYRYDFTLKHTGKNKYSGKEFEVSFEYDSVFNCFYVFCYSFGSENDYHWSTKDITISVEKAPDDTIYVSNIIKAFLDGIDQVCVYYRTNVIKPIKKTDEYYELFTIPLSISDNCDYITYDSPTVDSERLNQMCRELVKYFQNDKYKYY